MCNRDARYVAEFRRNIVHIKKHTKKKGGEEEGFKGTEHNR